MSKVKLAIAAAMKAKKTWDRLPPERKQAILDAAKKQGPAAAKKAAESARTHGPSVARRIAQAIEKARKP